MTENIRAERAECFEKARELAALMLKTEASVIRGAEFFDFARQVTGIIEAECFGELPDGDLPSGCRGCGGCPAPPGKAIRTDGE
jgi:hypothetical protein